MKVIKLSITNHNTEMKVSYTVDTPITERYNKFYNVSFQNAI